MQNSSIPYSRDLVLVGGGHTHALVLRRWAMKPLPGARLTLIDPNPTAAYSGMLPGHVAGHYTRDELDIDLVRLAQFAGARMVIGRACGLDRTQQRVLVEDHPAIGYDVLSLDIGITSRMPELDGFAAHGVPAKPLGPFARSWTSFRDGDGPAQVVVLGGGVAGAELAMAMAHGLRSRGREPEVTIIERETALTALGPSAATRLRKALAENGISLKEDSVAIRIDKDHVALDSGETIPARFVTGAAGAFPYPWLAETGLTDNAGFIPVDEQLRSADSRVFAVGDCAEMVATPRSKAGVYAVRQAPVLLHNLRVAIAETGGLKTYRPQKDYLKLISLGEKSAQAERFGAAVAGPLLWRWKDRIDRSFMEQFDDLPLRSTPVLPWPRAAGASEANGGKPFCGGCGSKIGRTALQKALSVDQIGDDSAILEVGNARQVISADHLRAFIDDPVAMTRIAAVHSLGDIWAMGAEPQAALASIVLPHQAPALAERHLSEIMEAAREVMSDAGAQIVGGHSTMGAELTIGFTVTGMARAAPIALSGARPGDRLVLTKPLGSGVIMAAHMQYRAGGRDVDAALREMMKLQGEAARLLASASAMTDVTGFGLVGHLSGLCQASQVGARIELDAVPLLPGALALSKAGIRSSLFRENRAGIECIPDDPHTALLFDPQTGGGLLAAVPDDTDTLCSSLRSKGFDAAVIGEVTSHSGQIEIV